MDNQEQIIKIEELFVLDTNSIDPSFYNESTSSDDVFLVKTLRGEYFYATAHAITKLLEHMNIDGAPTELINQGECHGI